MEIVLSIVGVVLVALAVPLGRILGQRLKADRDISKHWALRQAIIILIRYAEKHFKGEKRGVQKQKYVADRILKKFPWASNLKVKEFIESLIDEALNTLGNGDSSPTG